jgi:hypothetical protein
LSSLRPHRPLVFVVRNTPHVRVVLPMLRAGGTVVSLGDGTDSPNLGSVANTLRELSPKGIVTFSEPMLRVTSDLAVALGLPFHSPASVELLTDKYRQRQRLNGLAGGRVRTYRIRVAADWRRAVAAVGLPAVVKPTNGAGSRSTYRVDTVDSGGRIVAALLRDETDLVAEECLAGTPRGGVGDYVSVESVSLPSGVRFLAVTGKMPMVSPFREIGQFWPATITPAEQRAVLDLAGRAVAVLGVRHGITHTEVKLTPAGPRIIEVNGRLGGHINELSSRVLGLDLVRVAADIAVSGTAEPTGLSTALDVAIARLARLEGLHFQYSNAAPTHARRVLAVDGGRAVRQVDGISSYLQYVRAGSVLDPVRTQPLNLLCGHAADPTSMHRLIDKALQHAVFRFETQKRPRTMTGRDLHHEVG